MTISEDGKQVAKFFLVGAFVAAVVAYIALGGLGRSLSDETPWTPIGVVAALLAAAQGVAIALALRGQALRTLELTGGIGACVAGVALMLLAFAPLVTRTANDPQRRRRRPIPIALLTGGMTVAFGVALIRSAGKRAASPTPSGDGP